MLVSLKAGEPIEEFIDPYRALPGNVSTMGDKELGSKMTVDRTLRPTPSMPRAVSSSSVLGVGGVGVRGAAGIGRLEAMALSIDLEVS